MEQIKVVVADDFRVMRSFFEMSIAEMPRFVVVKTCESAAQAVLYCRHNAVDVLIMDIMMRQGIDGLTAAEQIKHDHPAIKIILTTSSAESTWETRAKGIGVESFWYKEYSEETFHEVLRRTAEGECVYPVNMPDIPFGDTTKSELTERELDVLRELIKGYSNQEIADRLKVSVNTVRTHIANMLDKTGFSSRLDLAIKAKELGLVVGNPDSD